MGYAIPGYIFAVLIIGSLIYVYYSGGSDDPGENYSIAFVTLMLGLIMGGIFL